MSSIADRRFPVAPESPSTARINRILGVPGAGKTYTTFEVYVDERKQDGYKYDDFAVASFTRAHTKECRSKFRSTWREYVEEKENDGWDGVELEDAIEDRVRTFHSWAWQSCSAAGLVYSANEQIIDTQEDVAVFESYWGGERAYRFVEDETDPLRMVRYGSAPDGSANRILAVDAWLAQHRYSPSMAYKAPVDVPFSSRKIEEEVRMWRSWKRENDLYQHHDYIDLAIEHNVVPSASIIIIDEYQDYSPAEHKLMTVWRDSESVDEITIIGDDSQSIYSFKGADPNYLLRTPADYELELTESRRCHAAISNVACGIMGEPIMASHPSTGIGTVAEERIEDSRDLADVVTDMLSRCSPKELIPGFRDPDSAAVFVLARTNYQVGKIASALMQEGIPFSTLSAKMEDESDDEGALPGPWTGDIRDIVRALRAVSSTGNVSSEQADVVLQHASNEKKRRGMLETVDFGGVSSESAVRLASAFPDADTPSEIVSRLDLTDRQKEMVRGATHSDVELDPTLVKVDTIHASKGDEAEGVLLFTGYTSRLYNRFHEDDEVHSEEHRTYYVGVTRAEKELRLAFGFVGGRQCPFFEDGVPRYYEADEEVFGDE